MVRNYKRKTEKADYAKEDLIRAVEAIRNGQMGTLRASKVFKVPRSTIRDHVKGRRGVKSHSLGRPTALPEKDETTLANSIK